jgi:hypothetical protein
MDRELREKIDAAHGESVILGAAISKLSKDDFEQASQIISRLDKVENDIRKIKVKLIID